MAATPSNMLPLGTKAFDFELYDTVSNQKLSLNQAKSKIATIIMFICNHCPYVIHILPELVATAKKYKDLGFEFIAINSNDIEHYPADSPDKMKAIAERYDFSFPYLFDETQAVAKAYQAACTPDFYMFDKNLLCVYRGRFDDSTPGNTHPVTGKELLGAMESIFHGGKINQDQKASIGCNIKWKNKSSENGAS
jgi:peroxiredoxin